MSKLLTGEDELSGQDVQVWREEHDLSQSQFCELAPLNLRTLQEWESVRGKGQPPAYFYRVLNDMHRELRRKRRAKRKLQRGR